MRIAIVNDLPIAIQAIRRALTVRPQHEIAWTAANGAEAVEECLRDRPDLLLMDLLMPVMDGVEATRRIMARNPCPILVVTSSISGNVRKIFEAMGAGALDVIDTPTLGLGVSPEQGAAPLLAKIDMMTRLLRGEAPGAGSARQERRDPAATRPSAKRLVVIGASAGGPAALAQILGKLPKSFPAPIVIVQHVDEQYASPLVRWLGEQTDLPVLAAGERDSLVPGRVLVAVKNDHLVLTGSSRLAYQHEPHDVFYRPSIDVFFESVARHWQGEGVGVILTGMGRDGALGLKALRKAGFHTISQDQASSAVYGMPKAAAQTGAAVDILSAKQISPALERWCRASLS